MIHERFCCNHTLAATTGLAAFFGGQVGGLAAQALHVLFKYASGLHGSGRPSHDAIVRFRDEPS
jgi:hypothetical protein